MSFQALLALVDRQLAPLAKAALPETDPVKVLTDVYERIGAMLAKTQESSGALPAGMAAEITTAAGMLLALAPGGAPPPGGPVAATTPAGVPAAAPGTAYLAQPGTVPVVLSQAAKHALAARLSKAELDAYTARVATVNAANERWWKMRNLYEQGKDDEATVELKGITEMLTNLVAGVAPSPVTASEKREITFTQERFAAYALGEVKKAALEPKEAALPRLAHLRAVSALAKAWFFEGTNPGLPWKVDIAAAYAPEGDGKALDLTTTKDQSQTEGDLLGGNPGTQTGSMFSGAALAKVEAALGELVAELAPQAPVAPEDVATPAELPPGEGASAPVTKNATFLWPSDLAAAVKAEEDEAETKKRGGVQKRLEPLPFGKDPWHASRAPGGAR